MAPEARGRGVGRRLVGAVEAAAGRLGARTVSLGADATAAGFYTALGYAPAGGAFHKTLPPGGPAGAP